jgi:hypothetical protein
MLEFIIKYWLETCFTIICGVFSFLLKKLATRQRDIKERQRAVENGVQALLRNELIRRYREYEIKGEITIIDKENMEHMFTEYENLGGNGTVAEMYKEILSLPIKIVK